MIVCNTALGDITLTHHSIERMEERCGSAQTGVGLLGKASVLNKKQVEAFATSSCAILRKMDRIERDNLKYAASKGFLFVVSCGVVITVLRLPDVILMAKKHATKIVDQNKGRKEPYKRTRIRKNEYL